MVRGINYDRHAEPSGFVNKQIKEHPAVGTSRRLDGQRVPGSDGLHHLLGLIELLRRHT